LGQERFNSKNELFVAFLTTLVELLKKQVD